MKTAVAKSRAKLAPSPSHIIVGFFGNGSEKFVRSIPYGSNVPTFTHLIQQAKMFTKAEAKKWAGELFAANVLLFQSQPFNNVKW
jgi:hypothetical protein